MPHPQDASHIKLSYITHFYLNQSSESSVFDLLKRYESYDPVLLDQIHFVIVDDGSPLSCEIPLLDLNLTWLRITQDIPWNQAGARNLGATYAKSDKILLTDLDHEFPESTLRAIVDHRECGRDFYKFWRDDPQTGGIKKGHANTFLISRARFMRFFGYDEEFAGHYGAEDYRFVKIHKAHGSRQRYFSKRFRCFERQDINREKAYHSLARDLSYNAPIDARKKEELLTYGADNGYSRIFLNFPWEITRTHRRTTTHQKPTRRLWKHLWYWRWLVGFR